MTPLDEQNSYSERRSGSDAAPVDQPSGTGGIGGLRRITLPSLPRGLDWATVLLSVPLVLAMVFLWQSSRTIRTLTSEVGELSKGVDSTMPKDGDQLTLPAEMKTLRGATVPLLSSTQQSAWVFFSTDCVLCMLDLPTSEGLERTLAAENVVTRFISVDPERNARTVVGRTTVELALEPKGLSRMLRVNRIPYYILVAPDGTIEWAHPGRLSEASKAEFISRIRQARQASIQ